MCGCKNKYRPPTSFGLCTEHILTKRMVDGGDPPLTFFTYPPSAPLFNSSKIHDLQPSTTRKVNGRLLLSDFVIIDEYRRHLSQPKGSKKEPNADAKEYILTVCAVLPIYCIRITSVGCAAQDCSECKSGRISKSSGHGKVNENRAMVQSHEMMGPWMLLL